MALLEKQLADEGHIQEEKEPAELCSRLGGGGEKQGGKEGAENRCCLRGEGEMMQLSQPSAVWAWLLLRSAQCVHL